MKLCKFVIGVKPQKRAFRVTSLSGALIDAVMEVVGGKVLPDEYFTRVRRSSDGSSITLMDAKEKGVNSFNVDTDSLIFTKDHYATGRRIDFNDGVQRVSSHLAGVR